MTHNDLYRELSNKVGAGHSSIVREIWETVCSREEASLLNALPATAEELVQRLGREREEIDGMIRVLFHKGLLFEVTREGKTTYRLPPAQAYHPVSRRLDPLGGGPAHAS